MVPGTTLAEVTAMAADAPTVYEPVHAPDCTMIRVNGVEALPLSEMIEKVKRLVSSPAPRVTVLLPSAAARTAREVNAGLIEAKAN